MGFAFQRAQSGGQMEDGQVSGREASQEDVKGFILQCFNSSKGGCGAMGDDGKTSQVTHYQESNYSELKSQIFQDNTGSSYLVPHLIFIKTWISFTAVIALNMIQGQGCVFYGKILKF